MGIVLVTGAAGFVGHEVCRRLRSAGTSVRGLVRSEGPAESALRRIGVSTLVGDLLDSRSLEQALQNVSVVVHAAARVGDHGPMRGYWRANVEGTSALLALCAELPVRRVVHVSSVDVYGFLRARGGELVDEDRPLPRSISGDAYARTKLEAEHRLHSSSGSFERVAVRPGWVYGAGDRVSLPRLAQQLRAGGVPLFEGGAHNLNLVHVRDLADALARLALLPAVTGCAFNAVGELVNVREFLGELARVLGASEPSRMLPVGPVHALGRLLELIWRLPLPGEPLVTPHAVRLLAPQPIYRSDRLRRLLGDWPRVGFRAGLQEAARWLDAEAASPQAS